jgi:hypothetical protein
MLKPIGERILIEFDAFLTLTRIGLLPFSAICEATAAK